VTPEATTEELALDEQFALTPEMLKEMLLKMHLTRVFEDAAFQQYALGKVHGTMHLCAGQEAVAVGAIAALRPDDMITSTHRGHGHAIAKGQDINTMMAELLAKETGVCRGRGGSMHMADLNVGSLGANGVVSGGLPLSVGAGLSIHLRHSDQVCICFFGDGASNEGAFHESINMAAVWKLPVIFLCENNQYGMSMSLSRANSSANIADRAVGYGIPGETVDGMDPLAVHAAVKRAVAHARSGNGPTLINALTYRYYGHSKSDKQLYRTKQEVAAWRDRDPIPTFANRLIAAGILSAAEAAAIEAQAQQIVEDSIVKGRCWPGAVGGASDR
jgi:TPP-dependent pyruvate/acetoin dehydrogenase alpha subunit